MGSGKMVPSQPSLREGACLSFNWHVRDFLGGFWVGFGINIPSQPSLQREGACFAYNDPIYVEMGVIGMNIEGGL